MDIELIREFLGWCTVLNCGIFALSLMAFVLLKDRGIAIHSAMFNLEEASVRNAWYLYLGYYKLALIVFNIVPYFALVIMSYSSIASR